MKTRARNVSILLAILVLISIVATSISYFYSPPTVYIGDQEIVGVAGFGATVIGFLIAGLACMLAFVFTSAILAGVSALLILIFAILAVTLALAVAPLCLPMLFLVGIVMLFNRRKTGKTINQEELAHN